MDRQVKPWREPKIILLSRMKRAGFCLLVVLLSIVFCTVTAAAADDAIQYSAKILVSEDKTISVAETLRMANPQADDTLIYTITKNVSHGQGDSIADIRVEGCKYTTKQTDDAVELTLSDLTEKVQISYQRITPADESLKSDTLAVLLLPASARPIRSATVSLVMPRAIDTKSLMVLHPNDIIFDYTVTAGVLSGSLLTPLPSGTAVVADFTLPEGYFQHNVASSPESQTPPDDKPGAGGMDFALLVAIAVASMLGLLVFTLSRGRGAQAEQDTWFDPAQAGYILRGFAKNSDLVALLPYWASLGYIRMEQLQDRRIHLTRVSQLPQSAPNAQKILFDALFGSGSDLTLGHLPQGFRGRLNQARNELERDYEQEGRRVFTKASYRAKNGMVICLFVPLAALLYCALPMGGYYAAVSRIVMSITGAALLLSCFIPVFDRLYAAQVLSAARRGPSALGLLAFLSVISVLGVVANWLHPQLAALTAASCAASIVLSVLYLCCRRRTKAGVQQLQALKNMLHEMRNPAGSQQTVNPILLYAYSVTIGENMASEHTPWKNGIAATMRAMQRTWNKLALARIIGWRFFQ